LTDGVTQIQTSLLMENPNPVISDNPTPADLVSNETIQVELPQVQLIAQDILKKAPQDRTGQIQGILDYLSVHYGYDADMAKNNIIRPLTTEEALARGHGVCQHYAVIFTAVARALKIPTRIVSGYALSRPNTAISHAWVEAEVQPSVWRVIEPQNKDGLTQTKTRYYFPVMRAAFLEDRGVPLTDFMADEMSRTLTFSPAP
jgi:transglutaminase-like putative cysteine protease